MADTLREHPRPGSNSNGAMVASALVKRYGKGTDSDATDALVTSITLASDPISADNIAQPSTKRNGDPGVIASAATGVRRLTPVECERLQGWPDSWTDLGGTPDSRRYAACGDGVTAHVAEWIGRRLLAQHVRRVAA